MLKIKFNITNIMFFHWVDYAMHVLFEVRVLIEISVCEAIQADTQKICSFTNFHN